MYSTDHFFTNIQFPVDIPIMINQIHIVQGVKGNRRNVNRVGAPVFRFAVDVAADAPGDLVDICIRAMARKLPD